MTGVTGGFTDIDNLVGGTDTDAFTLSGTGTLSGSIAGGGGAGVNTLTGNDVANTWGVTGNDSGTLRRGSGGYCEIDKWGADTDGSSDPGW